MKLEGIFNMAAKKLVEILASELPPEFIIDLKRRLTSVYKESRAKAVNDPAWSEAWDSYMYGNYRHVLSNITLEKLAAQHNLPVEIKKTETESANFCVVKTNKLAFTISHVKTPKSVPDRARHREQYSRINNHLPQRDMFEEHYIDNNCDIFAIICHGESKNSNELGFIGFSFTSAKGNRVLEHISLDEIYELQYIQTKKTSVRDIALAEVQKTEPVLKASKNKDKKVI